MTENSSVRPWDAKALAILHSFAAASVLIFVLLVLHSQGVIRRLFSGQDFEIGEHEIRANLSLTDVINGYGLRFWMILIGFGILNVFLARGVLRGQKWSPIVSMIISVLSIISSLGSFGGVIVFRLFLSVFVIYLAIICVKSPYFNNVK